MPLMTEAIDREDWELMDKGLSPKKKPQIVKPEQKLPQIDNQLKFEDIPLEEFESLISARRKNIKNENGAIFVGYDVKIALKTVKKLGRPSFKDKIEKEEKKEPEKRILSGWMLEGDWYIFYRHLRDKIDFKRISL